MNFEKAWTLNATHARVAFRRQVSEKPFQCTCTFYIEVLKCRSTLQWNSWEMIIMYFFQGLVIPEEIIHVPEANNYSDPELTIQVSVRSNSQLTTLNRQYHMISCWCCCSWKQTWATSIEWFLWKRRSSTNLHRKHELRHLRQPSIFRRKLCTRFCSRNTWSQDQRRDYSRQIKIEYYHSFINPNKSMILIYDV